MTSTSSIKNGEKLRPGAAVIFNFIDFDIHKLGRRTASTKDVQRLENVFHSLNLVVLTVNNPSLEELNRKIEDLRNYNFEMYASIQVVFMSHGTQKNILYCKNGRFDFLQKAKDIFSNQTLAEKPKYIIVQSCRGALNTNWRYDNNNSKPSVYRGLDLNAMLYSSFEGFQSYLNPNGSQFIDVFCKVLSKNWETKTYYQILEETRDNFNVRSDQQTATLESYYLNDNFCFSDFVEQLMPSEREFI